MTTPPAVLVPPTPLDAQERDAVRAAGKAAVKLLPPAIGELVQRELLDYLEFGYRLGPPGLSLRAAAEIEQLRVAAERERERERVEREWAERAARDAFRGPKPHVRLTASETHR